MRFTTRLLFHTLFTWLLAFSSLSGLTQENQSPSKLYWHFDRDFYVPGEMIRFAVFSTAPESPSEQMIVLEWVAPGGHVVKTQLIRMTEGYGAGDMLLEKSLKPGVYRIFAYPEEPAGHSKPDNLISNQIKIPVYSLEHSKNKTLSRGNSQDSTANGYYVTENTRPVETFDKKDDFLNIELKLDQLTFSKREPVKLQILTRNQNGEPVPANLAVSVLNQDFKIPGGISNNTTYQPGLPSKSRGQGILDIIAYIKDLKQTSLKALSRVSVFFIEDQIIEEFYIDELDDLTDVRNNIHKDNHMLIYGFNWKGDRLGELLMKGLEDHRTRRYQPLKDGLLYVKPVEDYLEFKKKSHLIDLVYEIPKADHLAGEDFSMGWGKPDFSVLLADFNRLPTMKEMIRGILPKAHVKKDNGKARIYLSPKTSSFKYDDTPLILINDIPTFDDSLVLALHVKDVEKMEVRNAIRTQGKFGTFGNKGILSVFLKDGVENPLSEKIIRWPKIKTISTPLPYITSRPRATEDKIPDFRQVLYWNPLVRTDQDGKAVVEFENSDVVTKYVIDVLGFARNGKIGKAVIQYQVIRSSY